MRFIQYIFTLLFEPLQRPGRGALGELTDMDFFTLNKRYIELKLLTFLREHRRDFRHKFALPEDFLKLDLADYERYMDTEENDSSSDLSET